MPFSEILFAKKFSGGTPTYGMKSPTAPSTCTMVWHVALLCVILATKNFKFFRKSLKIQISGENPGSMQLTLITRSTFESVGIFQWLNPETEKFFKTFFFNSLAPGIFQRNFRKVIFQLILVTGG